MAATTEHLDTRAPAAGLLALSLTPRRRHRGSRSTSSPSPWTGPTCTPPTSLDDAATVPGTEGELAIAGPGAPLVAEFCVPEFALATAVAPMPGTATSATRSRPATASPASGHASWPVRCRCGRPARIAQATLSLPMEGAAFVDRHVAPIAGKLSFAQLERTVEEARTRFDPDAAEQRRRDAAESRHFDIHTDQVSYDGTIHLDAELDLADALDLDTAITQVAEQLAALGCTETLDVRRAMAAGHLARHQLTLDLNRPDTTEPTARTVKPRQVVIYVHLSDALATGSGGARTPAPRSASTRSATGATTPTPRSPSARDRPQRTTPRPTPRPRRSANRCGRPSRPACSRAAPEVTVLRPRPHEAYADGGPTPSWNLAPLVPTAPPVEDPLRLDLPPHRTRVVPVDQPTRASTTPSTSPT